MTHSIQRVATEFWGDREKAQCLFHHLEWRPFAKTILARKLLVRGLGKKSWEEETFGNGELAFLGVQGTTEVSAKLATFFLFDIDLTPRIPKISATRQ